jgi:hypothetical protein
VLCLKVVLKTGEEQFRNVDHTISSQHARIEFEASSGQFFITDGTPTAPSSNGTWFRYVALHLLLVV